MTSFGLLLYGPAQHHWYGFLDRQFPQRVALTDFLSKVCTLIWLWQSAKNNEEVICHQH